MHWKYHQGIPFCAAMTAAPGRSSSPILGASSGRLYAFSPSEDDVGVRDRLDLVGRRRGARRSRRAGCGRGRRAPAWPAGARRARSGSRPRRRAPARRRRRRRSRPRRATANLTRPPPESCARRRRRCTLPVAVLGISSRTWITLGHLERGEPLPAVARSSSRRRVAVRGRRPRATSSPYFVVVDAEARPRRAPPGAPAARPRSRTARCSRRRG